ncbi:hypothetical protein QTJ16_002692 [Diplocarpon rosae]|uniref:WD repeat-containing protein n=1 Tax=Diplocarpon rosae TaxID=946125 RepID=A0AAD9T2H9_9HELO|nr:hypothetical protein QTJ16_002692 [Diplocarpon rosae]PBP17872.1 WD domain-containing protein [Diplocarpon rosae]
MSVQNPLTPPHDASTEAGQIYNSVPFAGMPTLYSTPSTFGTPTSMGLDGPEERSDLEERPTHSLSDEDLETADGGAALTMTLSHAEALNNEMDMLDAELMGHDNLVGLSEHPSYFSDSQIGPDHGTDDTSDLWATEDNVYTEEEPAGSASVPTTMSEVSQQLQHLQDGQAHVATAQAMDELHGDMQQHSIPSILLPFPPNFQNEGIAGAGVGAHAIFVYLSQIAHAGSALPLAAGAWETTISLLPPPASSQAQSAFHNPLIDELVDEEDADNSEVQDQFNLTLAEFLEAWGRSALRPEREDHRRRLRGPSLASLSVHREQKLDPIERDNLQGDRCDIQRINWADLGVSRVEARQQRRAMYRNYTNLRIDRQWHPRLNGSKLDDDQDFFRFRRMDFNHDINLAHFQLRNLIACASRDHIFYAGRTQVLHWNPWGGSTEPDVALDLTNPTVQPTHFVQGGQTGIQVSSLAVGHNILVAGGFAGEYALVNLKAQKDIKHTEGLVTENLNSITNHVEVHSARRSHSPLAAFASNDNFMRILDISSNTFIAEHKYDHAINCTAVSPDQRLRVLVGDTRQVMICNAESGEVLQSLDGHRDYGFSCDWADDGWTVATGNQDMQVKIWDARKWTNSQGTGLPLATISADMAGVRKLKFSPLGSGKRVLVAAEPADIISVIDGESFSSKQTLSFFGEIGGVDFTNDGQDLLVANCDETRGGLMQYERCGFATHGLYGLEEYDSKRKNRNRRRGEGHDWKQTDEEVVKHYKAKGTEEQRHRKAAKLGIAMGYF